MRKKFIFIQSYYPNFSATILANLVRFLCRSTESNEIIAQVVFFLNTWEDWEIWIECTCIILLIRVIYNILRYVTYYFIVISKIYFVNVFILITLWRSTCIPLYQINYDVTFFTILRHFVSGVTLENNIYIFLYIVPLNGTLGFEFTISWKLLTFQT